MHQYNQDFQRKIKQLNSS